MKQRSLHACICRSQCVHACTCERERVRQERRRRPELRASVFLQYIKSSNQTPSSNIYVCYLCRRRRYVEIAAECSLDSRAYPAGHVVRRGTPSARCAEVNGDSLNTRWACLGWRANFVFLIFTKFINLSQMKGRHSSCEHPSWQGKLDWRALFSIWTFEKNKTCQYFF